MPRIIAGTWKGRRLHTPGGRATRPTGARVRQTLFDIIAGRTRGCRFLDLFAGAGVVGLEAFSRGASRVVLVDRDRSAIVAIRRNLSALDEKNGAIEILRADCHSALARLAEDRARFDLVYLDPPYRTADYTPLLEDVAGAGILARNSIVVVEHFHKRVLPERIGVLQRFRSVKVGDHGLSLYRSRLDGRKGRES